MTKPSPHLGTQQTAADKALEIISKGGMARLREIKAAGIPGVVVARLAKAGRVVRLARGLYQMPDADIQAGHTLAEAAKIVPKGVICLISALSYHELTLQMPPHVWVAIENRTRQPKPDYPPMRFVRFSPKALSEGIDQHLIEGVPVRITNPARTIIDCFRFRNKIGVDIAISALREALRKRRCTADDIMKHAKELRIASVVRPYLEAMTTDDV
ncbi:MAG: type IV toxin-antitoxin system AbiEi family antitoxin domain-containing protein [Rhodospirillales bacterium]|nr:type IV toxin-antitoxin system AbiEi family antitoxin domain-containing protein [Rhodospirillales bacterium]